MNYIEHSNSLVIHGGYSEVLQTVLNDINILNLQNMAWYKIILFRS